MTIDRPNRRDYLDCMAQWVPPPLPAELLARRRGPLVGRAAELAAFEQAWERVEGGNRQAVFIGGEPGAGKTRLAAEVDVPYAPFAEALDRLLIATPPNSIAEPLGGAGPQLRRLSTQVDRHLDTVPAEPVGSTRQAL